jgi:hypothetical protein
MTLLIFVQLPSQTWMRFGKEVLIAPDPESVTVPVRVIGVP